MSYVPFGDSITRRHLRAASRVGFSQCRSWTRSPGAAGAARRRRGGPLSVPGMKGPSRDICWDGGWGLCRSSYRPWSDCKLIRRETLERRRAAGKQRCLVPQGAEVRLTRFCD